MFQVHVLDLNVHFCPSHSLLLDHNVHIWRSHRILWTSMSTLNCRNSSRGVGRCSAPAGRARRRPRGDGGGDDVPTTLDIWWSPGPTCPGTKCPVRGIPHFGIDFIDLQSPTESICYAVKGVAILNGFVAPLFKSKSSMQGNFESSEMM